MIRPLPTMLALVLLAGLLLSAPIFGTGAPTRAMQVDFAPYEGSLLYLYRGDIWRFDLATEEARLFLDVGPGLITHVAHSPDRANLAYSVLHLSPTYQILGTEIVVAGADGGSPQTVVREEGSRVSVAWPAWQGDGTSLLYTATNLSDGSQRVEEVDLSTGGRTLVVAGGSSATASPDGRWIAYDLAVGRRWAIWNLDRSTGARAQLVSDTWFDDADVPSFSPDSATLAFVAVGPGPRAARDPAPSLASMLGRHLVPIAEAHEFEGAVFDLWAVRPDGSGLRRVETLYAEQPTIAWSPTGRHIAVWGGNELHIVDMASDPVRFRVLRNPPGTGPISWGY